MSAKLFDELEVLGGEASREKDGKAELMVCPVLTSHDKQSSQSMQFPVKKGERTVGQLEINRCDIDTERPVGMRQVRFIL